MAVYRKLGPEFVYDSIGAVQRACAGVTPEDISARAAYEHTVFEIDPKLPPERHAESVRMYLGCLLYTSFENLPDDSKLLVINF